MQGPNVYIRDSLLFYIYEQIIEVGKSHFYETIAHNWNEGPTVWQQQYIA